MALRAPKVVQTLQTLRAPKAVQRLADATLSRFEPKIVQRFAEATLSQLERRWPTLARLLGRMPHREPVTQTEYVRRVEHAETPSADDGRKAAALITALRDPSAEVAVDAAEALQQYPGEATLAALREVVTNGQGYFNSATRAVAVRSLGVLLPAGALAPVFSAMRDVDAGVSLAAIASIADRAEDGCTEALLALLEDGSGFFLPPTRRAAARGLDRIRGADPARVRALLERESDSMVRDALAPIGLPS